ncbi:MAG: YhgE/Pip domain-containing protein [Eggerthellaceae bacterium]|nr:YhgE/Pip domain-containing protein [Eggerthellaceae bacterium]
MRNVLRVFVRDIKRLITTPAAWAVILFLTILPSLYTWFNVAGFWNPYDNTGNLRVCIVNEDTGAVVDGIGELDLGKQIVEQLQGNDRLGWAFVDRDTATEEVQSGAAYAAFVMPADFSSNVASILSSDFKRPEIEYFVNEKVGPVAPKITDTGANTLDATINEAFVSAVSEAVVKITDEKLADLSQAGIDARANAAAKVRKAHDAVANTREELSALDGKIGAARDKASDAKSLLDDAKAKIDGLAGTLDLVSLLTGNVNASMVKFSTDASSTLDAASHEASQSSGRTNEAIVGDANAIISARSSVELVIGRGEDAAKEADEISTRLTETQDRLNALGTEQSKKAAARLGEVIGRLNTASENAKRNLENLRQLYDDTAQTASDVRNASNAVNGSVQQTLSSADEFRSTLNTSIIPQISSALSEIASIATNLSAQSASQKAIVEQVSFTLDELSQTLDAVVKAVTATDKKFSQVEDELATLATDIAALGTSNAIANLIGTDRIDPATIADFMMSPTQLVTEQLYPLNAYGSAMAPLFINLTLWIGVFMLMVIMRLEVDDENVENLTITQRFYARLLWLAPLVCIQAAICCTGCLYIGVQSVNAPAFYATAIIASLAYLAIQYTLSSTLQHVGKAICIILVFVQIPGASGIYPIEMTPEFFRIVYPLFPFTYGINAMRETISGFYDGQWISCIGVLVAFMVAFLVIGTVARPYLTNLNRMFAREISDSDMIIGEDVELPARRWRMSQIIRALADREEYRVSLERRATRFMRLYPQLLGAALVVGIAVPVLAAGILSQLGADKVVILTVWLVWLVLVIAFLLAIEFIRDNLSHQLSLETMDADEMRSLIRSRNLFTRVRPLVQDVVPEEPHDDSDEGSAQ